MLNVIDLHANIQGTPILRGLNLQVRPGEIHAIMGPNGAGKSTLAKVLAGHPAYEITQGSVSLNGVELLELDPEERSWAGLFMSFQYPVEVGGITNRSFLREAMNAKRKQMQLQPLSEAEFNQQFEEKMAQLEMRSEFAERGLNEGFSGGEKKRNEILQMAMLDPVCAILDETDSGLDIDAMRVVACGVKRLMHPGRSLLLITHYQRLLDYIRPHYIHVMLEGQIIHSGDFNLAMELEEKGYDWLLAGRNA